MSSQSLIVDFPLFMKNLNLQERYELMELCFIDALRELNPNLQDPAVTQQTIEEHLKAKALQLGFNLVQGEVPNFVAGKA